MGFIKGLSRLGAVLASLGVIAMAFASHASAATAMSGTGGTGGIAGPGTAPVPSTVVHTVVVGGMPGWQIALIAVATALVAAAAAVLADRASGARRLLSRTPARSATVRYNTSSGGIRMPRFMDYHENLKLPARGHRADRRRHPQRAGG